MASDARSALLEEQDQSTAAAKQPSGVQADQPAMSQQAITDEAVEREQVRLCSQTASAAETEPSGC